MDPVGLRNPPLLLALLLLGACAANDVATSERALSAPEVISVELRREGPAVLLDHVSLGPGVPSKPSRGHIEHSVELRSSDGAVLSQQGLSAPALLLAEGRRPALLASRPLRVQFRWDVRASQVVVLDGQRRVLATAPVPPATGPTARFAPAPPIPVTVYDGCTAGQPCLDILFIAAGYSAATLPAFAATVSAAKDTLLATSPYSENQQRIAVRRIDNDTSLGCEAPTEMLYCDDAAVLAAASGATYDEIVVLYPGSGRANADLTPGGGGPDGYARVAIDYSIDAWVAMIVVHEFGHSWGGLRDEYLLDAGEAASGLGAFIGGPNCNPAGCADWAGVPGTGCFPGCGSMEFYRPTEDHCIMKTASVGDVFCPVCHRALTRLWACFGVDCSGAPAPGPCETPASCDNSSAVPCARGQQPDGSPCGAGADACNHSCAAGACTGVPVTCPDLGACFEKARCDPASGCVSDNKPTGTPCDDGLACTKGDTCVWGVCIGNSTCVSGPCTVSSCGATGCLEEPLADGAACSTACIPSGTCHSGVCAGATSGTCDADAGTRDASAQPVDAGAADASAGPVDAGAADAGAPAPHGSGCGCAVNPAPGAWLAVLGLCVLRRRRRRGL